MKRLVSIIAALGILLTHTAVFSEGVYAKSSGTSAADSSEGMYTENPDTSDWIVWENPSYSKRRGTAADASFLLDAPAGKHGFIYAEGENMYFGDGTRARFWGINAGREAVFGSFEEANELAERVAQSGYNLVRLHQMDDSTFDCIFGDSGAVTIDDAQLNKLFYFIACLKNRGIYVYMDLLVKRDLANAYENGYGSVGAAKFFDKKLIQLQKEYARKLLTTVNPFTGLALKDDPALVFVQLVNESGMFDIPANAVSKYYISEMNILFNDYLSKKYKSDAELSEAWKNSDGGSGINNGESLENRNITFFGDGSESLGMLFAGYGEKKRADIYEFLYNTTEDYYVEMKEYLRGIGVRAMLTGVGMGGTSNQVPANVRLNKEHFDFVDRHLYMAHPSNGFDMVQGLSFWGPSMLYKPEIFKSAPASKVYNIPYILGEWEECNTGEYRAEAMPMMAGYACFQNYTPIHFCLISGRARDKINGYIDNPFSVYNDPIQTAAAPISAMIYLRHEVDEAESVYYDVTSKKKIINEQSRFNDYDDSFRYLKRGVIYDDMPDYTEAAADKNAYNEKYTSGMSKLESKINEQMSYSSFDKSTQWQNAAAKDFHMFSINSDYTNLVTGFETGKKYEFDDSFITYKNQFAMVGLTSVTNEKLSDSNRMLITAVGRARNTGYELDYANSAIKSVGTAPVLAEPVDAEITIKTDKNITVYALDSSGRRKARVPVTDSAEGKSFCIDKSYKALFYEAVKEDTYSGVGASADFEFGAEVHGFAKAFAGSDIAVSVEKDGKEYLSAVTAADEFGNFDLNIPINKEIPDGTYNVTAKGGGGKIVGSLVYADYDRPSLTVSADIGEKRLSICGRVTLGGAAVKSADVAVAVIGPLTSAEVADEAMAAENVYDIKRVTTDANGMYSAELDFLNTESGMYCVRVIASGRNGKQAYRSYPQKLMLEYGTDKAYIELWNARDNRVEYAARPGETITGAVRGAENAEGVLLMAVYRDGVLIGAARGDEKGVSYRIPDAEEGLSVKLIFVRNLSDMEPLTDSVSIRD